VDLVDLVEVVQVVLDLVVQMALQILAAVVVEHLIQRQILLVVEDLESLLLGIK
jgi:hypothetical protein